MINNAFSPITIDQRRTKRDSRFFIDKPLKGINKLLYRIIGRTTFSHIYCFPARSFNTLPGKRFNPFWPEQLCRFSNS